jgi:hypothetical protein
VDTNTSKLNWEKLKSDQRETLHAGAAGATPKRKPGKRGRGLCAPIALSAQDGLLRQLPSFLVWGSTGSLPVASGEACRMQFEAQADWLIK